jgi:hypothetical protein
MLSVFGSGIRDKHPGFATLSTAYKYRYGSVRYLAILMFRVSDPVSVYIKNVLRSSWKAALRIEIVGFI